MTTIDPTESAPAPILVLGLGNLLLRDDGAGLELLSRLRPEVTGDPLIEMLDGGTQGLALLPRLAQRRAMLVLDAVARGAEPGTTHVVDDARVDRPSRGGTAHETNAGELIAAAEFIGDCPDLVMVVGIEPLEIRTGIGLSPVVSAAVPDTVDAARRCLDHLTTLAEAHACTS